MWHQLKTIKSKVENLLICSYSCRQSDSVLVANYYSKEISADLNKMSAFRLLNLIATGKLPSSDAITRVARKIMEQRPELRGDNHERRVSNEVEVRNNIKDL